MIQCIQTRFKDLADNLGQPGWAVMKHRRRAPERNDQYESNYHRQEAHHQPVVHRLCDTETQRKAGSFLPEEAEAKITLEERRELIILELTVKYNGIIYRAEQSAKDKNDALDVTVDRVIRQIRKQKTKVEKNLRTGAFEGLSPEAEEKEYEVIREKKFHLRPMSVDEAILQMNLLDHTFFMFKNADTGDVNVVYKRDEGNYAVLVPEG